MGPKREAPPAQLSEEEREMYFTLNQLGGGIVSRLSEKQLLVIVNLKIRINDLKIALDGMEDKLPADQFKDVKQLLRQAVHYLQMEPARNPPDTFYDRYCDAIPKHLANARQKLLFAEGKISNDELKAQVAEFRELIGGVINDIPGAIAAPMTPSSAGIMTAMGAAKPTDAKKATPAKLPLAQAPAKPFQINAMSIGELINYIADFQTNLRDIALAVKTTQPEIADLLKKVIVALNKRHTAHNDMTLNTISCQFINLRNAIVLLEAMKNHEQYQQLTPTILIKIANLQNGIEKIIRREPIEIIKLNAKYLTNSPTLNLSNATEEAIVRKTLFAYADKMLQYHNELKRRATDATILGACTGMLRSIKHELQHGTLDTKKIISIQCALTVDDSKDARAARNMEVIQEFKAFLDVLVKKAPGPVVVPINTNAPKH